MRPTTCCEVFYSSLVSVDVSGPYVSEYSALYTATSEVLKVINGGQWV